MGDTHCLLKRVNHEISKISVHVSHNVLIIIILQMLTAQIKRVCEVDL